MNELLAVGLITVLAVISPGPDFAMVTRNSYAFGRQTGFISSLGIAVGVQIHVFYTVAGLAVLTTRSPGLFTALKLAGAAYLMYLGCQSLANRAPSSVDDARGAAPTAWRAFGMGFLTNALNPKTMLFVVAVFTQVIQPGTSYGLNLAYGFLISLAHGVWFGLVALMFSEPMVRSAILARQRGADVVIGVALLGLGGSLLFTNAVA